MHVALTIGGEPFDLGHMALVQLIELIDDITIHQPLFSRLAEHPDSCVRIAVSKKVNLSPEAVRFLLKEKSVPEIQENIMHLHLTSPGMTYEALMSLVEEGGDNELLGVVHQIDQLQLNDEELESLITRLTTFPSSKVRMMLARNCRLPEWALRRLAQDDDELVVQRAHRSLALQKAVTSGSENELSHISAKTKAFSSMSNLMLSNYKELEKLYSGHYDTSVTGGFHWEEAERCKTGIDDVDLMTGGMRRGEVTLIAGIRDSGTTTFALNVAVGVGTHPDHRDKEGGKVVLFSLQHSEEELSMRMLSCESTVNFEQMRMGTFDNDAWRKLAVASGTLAESKIYAMYVPDLSIYEVVVACKKAGQSDHPIDLIIIDRLDLMNPFVDEEKREQEFGDVMEKLRSLATELDVSILLTVSIRNQNISQQTLRSWSKSLFDSADTVMCLDRRGKTAELKMYKHIVLPASSAGLSYNRGELRFDSASKNW